MLGIIGGSGLYDLPGLTDTREVYPETPFGYPSSPIVIGMMTGQQIAFLTRHGRGHVLLPSEVPSRANIWALKLVGCEIVVGITACGSLREEIVPGHVVIPDQLFDHTSKSRPGTFFGKGLVGHIGLADPFCSWLRSLVADAVEEAGGTVHRHGLYIIIEGPAFGTRGESNIYRQWSCDIVGETIVPEYKLAREAELCYGALALVTDYDSWRQCEEDVSVTQVEKVLHENATLAQRAIAILAGKLAAAPERTCVCASALEHAIMTVRNAITPITAWQLDLLVGKYLRR